MLITGKIVKSLPSKEWAGKNGKNIKRTFVIEVPAERPYELAIEVINERGDVLKGLKKGDSVSCTCTVASREYENKYFTAVTATKIEPVSNQQPGESRVEYDHSDLPF